MAGRSVSLANWHLTRHGRTGLTRERHLELWRMDKQFICAPVGKPELVMDRDLFQPQDDGDPSYWLLVDLAKRKRAY